VAKVVTRSVVLVVILGQALVVIILIAVIQTAVIAKLANLKVLMMRLMTTHGLLGRNNYLYRFLAV